MHCFRRAIPRLLSSVSAPSRSRSIVATRPFPSVSPRQPTLYQLQSRWNSDIAQRQHDAEQRGAEQPEQAQQEVKQPEEDRENVDAHSGTAEPLENARQEGEEPLEAKQAGEAGETDRTSVTKRAWRRELLSGAEPKETVFVGNLFFDVTAENLRKAMERFGVVERTMIVFDSRGLSKGFGYVEFDTVESAKRAIEEMHLRIFEGRRVTVQFAHSNIGFTAKSPATRTLYVGNISFALSDREMHDLFKDIQNVIDVRVSVDRRTGMPKGFAHADFLDVESAKIARDILVSKAPNGRRLKVDFTRTLRRMERRPGAGRQENSEQGPEE